MRQVLFFVAGILLWSCAEKVVEPPENLISEEKMVDVLHDLALLNSTKTSFAYYQFGISEKEIPSSLDYFAPNSRQMIYEKVEAKLETKRKTLEEGNKKRNDSTRAVQKKKTDSL
ncbi:MAG: DUF4296 domain-containing protein, partial [Bacteroidota bacterium]